MINLAKALAESAIAYTKAIEYQAAWAKRDDVSRVAEVETENAKIQCVKAAMEFLQEIKIKNSGSKKMQDARREVKKLGEEYQDFVDQTEKAKAAYLDSLRAVRKLEKE